MLTKIRKVTTTAIAILIAVCHIAVVEPAEAQEPNTQADEGAKSTFEVLIETVKDLLPEAGAAATVVAVIVGGFVAWSNTQIFRAKAPHVVISHEISHRFVGAEYVHIFVTAILHNSSRVHVEFLDGFSKIQHIKPISDGDVEFLYAQVFVDKEFANLQWTDLDVLRHRWERDGLLVEPGETETEIFDFLLRKDIKSVALTTYFYNARVVGNIPNETELNEVKRRNRRFRRWLSERAPLGWGRTSVYDRVRVE